MENEIVPADQRNLVGKLGVVQRTFAAKDIFDILIQTVEYGCWAAYVDFADSPEFGEMHIKMKEHLELVERLDPVIQLYLSVHISQIRQVLHMAEKDFEAAYEEAMRNDPEAREIMERALKVIAQSLSTLG